MYTCTLYTTNNILYTNNKQSQVVPFLTAGHIIYDQNLVNLQDRDNLRTKDNRPVPKVSFVRRFDCIPVHVCSLGILYAHIDQCLSILRMPTLPECMSLVLLC